MKIRKGILLAAAVMLAVFTVGCSFSFSTAKIEDAIMTNSVDAEGKPGEAVTSFTSNAQTLYTSAVIKSAPDHTKIRIVWTYVTNNQLIDEVELDSGTVSDRYIYSDLWPSAPLPAGDYKVEYFIEDRKEPDATVLFTVNGAYLEDIHMTSYMDANGVPADTIDTVDPAGPWYVSAVLRNTQPDTKIHFIWYDTSGTVIDSYEFDPAGETDVYISGSMTLNSIAPEGQYKVELYIDDAATPAATVDFTVSAISSENAVSSADFKLYTQAEGGFSIKYPGDWLMLEEKDSLAAGFYPIDYAVSGQDDLNTVIVYTLKDTTGGNTIDAMLKLWVSLNEDKNLENYTLVDQGTDTVNGYDMAYYEYSWTRDEYNLYSIDFLINQGTDLYVITFTSTQDALDTLYPYVEQMVLSFNIL